MLLTLKYGYMLHFRWNANDVVLSVSLKMTPKSLKMTSKVRYLVLCQNHYISPFDTLHAEFYIIFYSLHQHVYQVFLKNRDLQIAPGY